jgi:uncharacterized protein YjiS (DUF1127 family)
MHNCIAAMRHWRFKNRLGAPISGSHKTTKQKRTKDETRKTMNLISNYRNWRRYRDTVSELSRLSNRELTDLGITRSDIPFVARKSI